MKRRILSVLVFLFTTSVLWAQKEVVEKNYPFSGQEIDIEVKLGTEIKVKAWDKQEIAIKVTYEVNEGKNNDAVTLDFDEYNDRLSLDVDVSERKMRDADYCCCRDGRGTYWNGDNRSRNCIDLVVEVLAPANARLRVESVIADVTLEGMSGDIEVETVTGTIDLAWMEGIGAEVTMTTTMGDLYTNIDLDRRTDRGLQLISSHKVEGTYKNGERSVMLKTVTSDIYFRKPRK